MPTFNVNVTGLGGPAGKYVNRQYEVDAETAGAALDKGLMAFDEDMADYERQWTAFENRVLPWSPVIFSGASVSARLFGGTRRIL